MTTTTAETSVTTQVHRVYIKATPDAIWDAITKPEWTDRYGYGGIVDYGDLPVSFARRVSPLDADDPSSALDPGPSRVDDADILTAGARASLAEPRKRPLSYGVRMYACPGSARRLLVVLGEAHVDAANARANAFTRDFNELVVRHAWADIWARPGLERTTRSCITLAMLAALGCAARA